MFSLNDLLSRFFTNTMALSQAQSRFRAELVLANDKQYANIGDINKGDIEDEFTFMFNHHNLPYPSEFKIHVQLQDVRHYPGGNTFLLYTNDEVPPTVARVLEESLFETTGMKIDNLLVNLSQRLRNVLEHDGSDVELDTEMADAISDGSESDLDDLGDSDEYDLLQFDDESTGRPTNRITQVDRNASRSAWPLSQEVINRIQRDFRSVIHAGFHTGQVRGLEDGDLGNKVSISIRVNKLSLSKETREAWGLASSDYIVLLIRYDKQYSTYEDVINNPVSPCTMSFRLRKCSKKKPSNQDIAAAFSSTVAPEELAHIWISKSIDEFMNNEFISMLKLRKLRGISWDSAKELLHSRILSSPHYSEELPPSKGDEEPTIEPDLPSFLSDDHLSSNGELSLPLIAMQFTLRYLVKCTDFCTVCHRKVEGNFAALMPYVCSEPLCLYQYMSLGLGPSIDYEIVNQPYVVDLLISFAYSSLPLTEEGRVGMREFPTGLGLQVPKIRGHRPCPGQITKVSRVLDVAGGFLLDPVDMLFNWNESTAEITEDNDTVFSAGQSVVAVTLVHMADSPVELSPELVLHHARVESKHDRTLRLNILSQHTIPGENMRSIPNDTAPQFLKDNIPGHIVLCDDELDCIPDERDKAFCLKIILAAMPSVTDMRSYLMSSRESLAKWDRMTRVSVDLLRWIIASNRSYLVHVDENPADGKPARLHEKISGVEGCVQFRFAQGSPEKEDIFNKVLAEIEKPHKTLLAWHGSALENWHSIIRQGLDYTDTHNGRSYGNGIYFSTDFDYSVTYSDKARGRGSTLPILSTWPQSALQVSYVISLNELVNLPEQFVCQSPHYVVQHCHWTQCRYLFVKAMATRKKADDGSDVSHFSHSPSQGGKEKKKMPQVPPVPKFIQDPDWPATGPEKSRLSIPKYAIPSTRGGGDTGSGSLEEEPEIESSDDDKDDLEFILRDDEADEAAAASQTDFCPGTLDFSNLPQLTPPSYATNTAQKALGQEIKRLQKTQSSTPLHQLGWYIDFEKMTNLFQWIVELHSFDESLPLAQDMKAVGLTSIVLEIRFLRGFPISPPFVRVIRPRFLSFMNGGGGHVTSGGAMCMELLTNSGWSPANSMESVLLQVRMAMCNVDPQPARLQSIGQNQTQYGVQEAVEAYRRAALAHGWEVPPDLLDASSIV
ncbi:hypothetical protein F4804DRAFT_353811 [Jackrogersella minutella]|nr:hypothetical protein F4804DRAFT_353811 [Jackrogersella minutella]